MTRALACPCGMALKPKQKKYCSKACLYKYRVRPKGLKYTIHKENPTWIKKGQHFFPEAGFQPGHTPVNKLPDNEVGYASLHQWVRRHLGRAAVNGPCAECEHDGSNHRLEWANKSLEYKRVAEDWMVLCTPCHRRYDFANKKANQDLFERGPGGYGKRKLIK
jgi:hypothetical protein